VTLPFWRNVNSWPVKKKGEAEGPATTRAVTALRPARAHRAVGSAGDQLSRRHSVRPHYCQQGESGR